MTPTPSPSPASDEANDNASPAQGEGRKPKRSVLARLFGLSVWGYLKLALTSVLVGFVVLAVNFDPAAPGFDLLGALGSVVSKAAGAAGWAVQNLWQPALAGAGLVLPVWVLWRLVSLPFRR